MTKLYGDGVTCDTEAIQALLDSGAGQIVLPQPQECYLIDKPLVIHSGQELALPRYAVVKLKAGSACRMLCNANEKGGSRNIAVRGGIWDYNNLAQPANPGMVTHPDLPDYDGKCFVFSNVKNLTVEELTFKDVITFACTLDTVSYFTVRQIVFDYNLGNPRPINMDGIHLNGNCHYGLIDDLKGRCYDDTVAINADEGSGGPITNIEVRGIFAEECHSAVRLLTVKYPVKNIHVHDVYGTFYQYGIGVTKFYEGETTGYFDALCFDRLFMSKSPRYTYLHVNEDYALHGKVYPMIYVESGTRVKSLSVSDFYRVEETTAVPSFEIENGAVVDNLTLNDCYTENRLSETFDMFKVNGTVKNTVKRNVRMINGKADLNCF